MGVLVRVARMPSFAVTSLSVRILGDSTNPVSGHRGQTQDGGGPAVLLLRAGFYQALLSECQRHGRLLSHLPKQRRTPPARNALDIAAVEEGIKSSESSDSSGGQCGKNGTP